MALRFYNTMSRKPEEFTPIDNNKVRMYTCGPTVHDYAHIGNFRTYMFEDLLRRFLKYKGYEVTQIMNLTDIDDKTIRKSKEQGISLDEYTDKYKIAFFEDLDTLRIERAEEYPEATKHIDEMVAIVKKLIDKGMAYEVDGNYYFSIAKFGEYGKLSHVDLDGLKAGARVASDEYEKESVSDFALWKVWDENDGDVFWETELGKGRPGWHLECSAMSMKYLGESFDIHTGGVDNMFPHHENEIAQSEGATGKPFSKYWMHSKHLIVDGRKMSKSLNNFFTLRQVMEKEYSSLAVRYLLLATHYRQQLNFTFDGIDAMAKSLARYNDFYTNLKDYAGGESNGEAEKFIGEFLAAFESALDDDLNISAALGSVFDFIRDINRLRSDNHLSADERDKALSAFEKIDKVLDFIQEKSSDSDDADIKAMIQQRAEAKKNKDFATADNIRDDLLNQGIILEDGADGTKWKRKI